MEANKINTLTNTGIVECRVTKPSRKAAAIKMGTRPMSIFEPSLAPLFIDANRLKVPGKIMLLPRIKPAAPAMMIEEISNVPCIQITSIDFNPRPLSKK